MKRDETTESSVGQPPPLSRVEQQATLDCREVFKRYQHDDSASSAEFVARYRAPVFSYLLRWGLEHSVCEDLFQEVFTKIHIARRSYDATRSLPTWVFTIVINVVRDHWRKSGRADEEFVEDQHVDMNTSPLTDRLSARQWLERELPKLPAQQREVLILCCVQDLTMDEAATAMEIPPNTVKTLLRRGRQTLAERMVRYKQTSEREVLS